MFSDKLGMRRVIVDVALNIAVENIQETTHQVWRIKYVLEHQKPFKRYIHNGHWHSDPKFLRITTGIPILNSQWPHYLSGVILSVEDSYGPIF